MITGPSGDKYLENPAAFMPGNKMTYAGVKDDKGAFHLSLLFLSQTADGQIDSVTLQLRSVSGGFRYDTASQ